MASRRFPTCRACASPPGWTEPPWSSATTATWTAARSRSHPERCCGGSWTAPRRWAWCRSSPPSSSILLRESEDSLEEKGYRTATLRPLTRRLGAYGVYRGTTDEHILRPLARHLEEFGIPVEDWNPEGGFGQYEVNLVYGELPEAAERAFLSSTR